MSKWKRGQSGNPNGRPLGSRNRSTAEIKTLLAETIPFKKLVEKLSALALRGNVRAAELLLAYRYGRPSLTENVNLNTLPDRKAVEERARETLAALLVSRDEQREEVEKTLSSAPC